jgi:hypothetical protein
MVTTQLLAFGDISVLFHVIPSSDWALAHLRCSYPVYYCNFLAP